MLTHPETRTHVSGPITNEGTSPGVKPFFDRDYIQWIELYVYVNTLEWFGFPGLLNGDIC